MSNVLVPLPEAAVPERPTLEGERALRQALGYMRIPVITIRRKP